MAEKSTTKMSTRIIILFGAAVFLLSSVTLTVFVIIELAQGGSDSSTKDVTATTCDIGSTSGEVLAAPEVFKPEGDVTKLETTDLTVGTGEEAKDGSCLIVKYYGTLADGTLFDENYTKATDLRFQLGKGQVIKGWDQGVKGMKVGGERRIVIPSDLGYGEAGSPPTIPANADLVFVVKLVKIQE